MKYKIFMLKIFWIASFFFCFLVFAKECVYSEVSQESVASDLQSQESQKFLAPDLQIAKCLYSPYNCSFSIGLGQTEGRWIGNNQGYSSVVLFVPLPTVKRRSATLLPFLDLRISHLNGGRYASNLGGGVRVFDDRKETMFGVNAYYDTYGGDFRYYHQLGIGCEWSNRCFDLRVNTYISLGSSTGHSHLCVYDDYIGDYFATSQQYQTSMQGFEFEFGKWIKRDVCNIFSLYGAIGPYFFISQKHGRHRAYGGQARLFANITPYISCEIRGGYDPLFHSAVQASIMVTIPFFPVKASCCSCGCDPYLCQPVYRQKLIVLDKKQCCWTWNWDDNL